MCVCVCVCVCIDTSIHTCAYHVGWRPRRWRSRCVACLFVCLERLPTLLTYVSAQPRAKGCRVRSAVANQSAVVCEQLRPDRTLNPSLPIHRPPPRPQGTEPHTDLKPTGQPFSACPGVSLAGTGSALAHLHRIHRNPLRSVFRYVYVRLGCTGWFRPAHAGGWKPGPASPTYPLPSAASLPPSGRCARRALCRPTTAGGAERLRCSRAGPNKPPARRTLPAAARAVVPREERPSRAGRRIEGIGWMTRVHSRSEWSK